jgi:hypothetical protein
MKETIAQILSSPFNWTGLTLPELIVAGRVSNVDQAIGEIVNREAEKEFPNPMEVGIGEYMKWRGQFTEEMRNQLKTLVD